MFETLFTYPRVLRRHREGPLAEERAAYLAELAAQCVAPATLIKKARCCLRVAVELQRWPADHCFDNDEVREMASRYAARCRAASSRNAREHFRATAVDLLRRLDRLRPERTGLPHRYEAMLCEFIELQHERSWLSDATCHSARWQITKFLGYLEQRSLVLETIHPADVDAFYQHMSLRWSRRSLSRSVSFLRAWLGYCERQGYARSGLAKALIAPRIYRHESLPMGPTWPTIAGMLAATGGDDPTSIRDHAIILLLSVYGVRSGEVRRLRLDDIDWRQNRIRFVRSKSGRHDDAPLVAQVGNAMARYLHEARPQSTSRVVFLRARAPFTPLSPSGLYSTVKSHFPAHERPAKGRGPHGLRHQRGLCESTIERHQAFLKRFMTFRFGATPGNLNDIAPDDILAFVAQPAPTRSCRVVSWPTHLRSLFRFLFWSSKTRRNLALSIPRSARSDSPDLPCHLASDEIRRLTEAVHTDDALGRRNHAMLLLMARLGLRAPEVIAIRLEDIDWRAGEILIRGKGKRYDRMPLPVDVGEAIVAYLRDGRASSSRHLFVSRQPPHRPFTSSAVVNRVLRGAFEKTGLKPPQRNVRTHLLRHSLAVDMLGRGASLQEIGDVLRHRSRMTTTIYARYDIAALRSVARDWPVPGEVR